MDGNAIRLIIALIALACADQTSEQVSEDPGLTDSDSASNSDTAANADAGLSDRFTLLRGVIHMHSALSHDACDGEGLDESGQPKPYCIDRLREGLCVAGLDFMFLTDHPANMRDFDWPTVVMHNAAKGDVLIDGAINHMACEDGPGPLIYGGFENGRRMGVAMREHLPSKTHYDNAFDIANDLETDKLLAADVHAAGGLAFVDHVEEKNISAERMAQIPVDGLEIYNLHPNVLNALQDGSGANVEHLGAFLTGEADPFYVLMVILNGRNKEPFEKWDAITQTGQKMVAFAGSDMHENVDFQTTDGERIDAYKRALRWFSNHVFADDSSPAALEAAVKAGRMAVVFDIFGQPDGFDFYAVDGDGKHVEIGQRSTDARRVILKLPKAPEGAELRGEVVRAGDEMSVSIDADVGPGAYRAVIYIRPLHVSDALAEAGDLADVEFPWIYTNPLYLLTDGATAQ